MHLPAPWMPRQGEPAREPARLAAGSQHFSFQSLCVYFPSSFLPTPPHPPHPKRRMPLLLSTQPVILLSDLSREVSVVTDCVRIAPLRVITLNSPLKDSSLWIEYKKTPQPPFTEIHDFCGCHWHPDSETLLGTPTTWRRVCRVAGPRQGEGVVGRVRQQVQGGHIGAALGTRGPGWPAGTGPEPGALPP